MWKSIIDGLVRLLYTWWKAEQAEASEWEAKARAGQVESLKNVRLVEQKIDAAAVRGTATLSARAWNASGRGASPPALVLLIVVSLCSTGCPLIKYVYVEGAWPIIAVPARPTLPEDPPEFTGREVLLVDYASLLETKIDAYNAEAVKHNGYSDPEGENDVGKVREEGP